MTSFVGLVPIGVVIVAVLFGSAMLAMAAASFLPPHHLSAETKGVVSVSAAVVWTMSALVIGLLISNSSASFTSKTKEVTQISVDVINLDRMLRRFGPETQDMRAMLRRYAEAKMQDLFPGPSQGPDLENVTTLALLEQLQDKILALTPASPVQHWLQGQAVDLTGAMMAARWRLVQENTIRTPLPLLVLVIFWFVMIFVSFGLFAPRNGTAIMMIFLSSLAIGGAIRMTTELQIPFQGLVRISGAPLDHAVDVISH
jgi:hypothetical protein